MDGARRLDSQAQGTVPLNIYFSAEDMAGAGANNADIGSWGAIGTSQTITFGALPNQTLGAAPFRVSAAASSGLTVSFASLTTSVCSVSGVTVALVATGTCTIQATQAGNASYSPAPAVNQSFTVALPPDLTIVSTHNGSFTQGLQGAYQVTVTNSGAGSTSGTATVVDTLPPGLTPAALAGANWNCTLSTVTCTNGNVLAAGGSYSPITVTVNVTTDAGVSVTNIATVSGGGEINTANDQATDPTTVIAVPDLTITSTHTGNFTQGQAGATYSLTVSNIGIGPTSGTVTVTESVPTGLALVSMSGGTAWACSGATCTRSDPLAGGTSYSAITVTVNVVGSPGVVTNAAAVSGGGEINTSNDRASDVTTILGQPDFTLVENFDDLPIAPNSTVNVPLSTKCVNGFTGNIIFYAMQAQYANSQTGQYSGDTLDATGIFSAYTIPCGASATLQLTIGPSLLQDQYYYATVWANATIPGQIEQTVYHWWTYELKPTTSQAAGIAATPYAQSVVPGGTSGPFTINLSTANNFVGSVSLTTSVSGPSCGPSAPCPSAILASYTLSASLLSTTMTVSTSANTPAGVYTIVVSGPGVSTNVQLTVGSPPAPSFTLTATPSSVLVAPGGAVQYSITATSVNGFNGQVSFSYSCPNGALVGFVPSSLFVSDNATTAATVVVPLGAASGTTSCIVTGASGASPSQSVALNLIVAGPAPVITGSLPMGVVGVAYMATLTASGGTPGYTWTLAPGATLPAGLTFSGGTISGTPTAAGSSSFTVTVTDSLSATASQKVTLTTVNPRQLTAQPQFSQGGPSYCSNKGTILNNGTAQLLPYCLGYYIGPTFYCDNTDYNAGNGDISNLGVIVASSGATASGLTASFAGSPSQCNPGQRATYDVSYTAAPSAAPGSYALTFQYTDPHVSGQVTPNPFNVYDATPVITQVVPDQPIIAGGQAYVTLFGYNFGSSGSVLVCTNGTGPCTQAPGFYASLNAPYSCWGDPPIGQGGCGTDGQINILLTSPAGSGGGTYYFQVSTTTDATGASFLASSTEASGGNSNMASFAVDAVAMQLTQVGATVINPANNYSEDTTIQITAVDATTGATLTNFTGAVNIAEVAAADGTTIYSQNGGSLVTVGGKPVVSASVNITAGGTATFVAQSLAGPKVEGPNGQPPDAATIGSANYPVWKGINLPVPQWITSGAQIDPHANGQAFDWFQTRARDLFAAAAGDLATVMGAIRNYTLNGGLATGGCSTDITRAAQSPVTCNPYYTAYRINGNGGNTCGLARPNALSNALYHEARHAYQGSLSALPGNDADGDWLVNNVPIAPTTGIKDTTDQRLVCNPNLGADGSTLMLAYQGDQVFDTLMAPNWVWYALEMDAYVFAGSH